MLAQWLAAQTQFLLGLRWWVRIPHRVGFESRPCQEAGIGGTSCNSATGGQSVRLDGDYGKRPGLQTHYTRQPAIAGEGEVIIVGEASDKYLNPGIVAPAAVGGQ